MTGKRATIYSAAPNPAPQAPYVYDREARAEQEWQLCHAERARLAARARYGKDWDGKEDNDNEPRKVVWPLAKALVAEGNTELLKTALAYRKIYNTAKSEVVLGGKAIAHENLTAESLSIAVESVARDDGSVTFGKVRKSRGINAADVAPKRKVAANDETTSGASSVPKPWNGDMPVIDMIDAKVQLARLQARLGPLAEPLEMAVMDDATLQAVGNAAGIANRAGSMGAGRALVHMALIMVRDALGRVR